MLLVPGEPTDVRCTEEGAVGPPVCPAGTFCVDGACRDGPPALGEPCSDDRVCAAGDVCFDPASVGLEGQELCSHPCCSSADCGVGTGLVCAVLGPGKMCLPAEGWGRSPPGTRFAGEPCASGADCRSGECSTESQRCADACCSGAECALFAGACRDDGDGWACKPALPEARAYLEPCTEDHECASGLCLDWTDGARRCSAPCCSSVECGDVPAGDFVLHILCVPVQHGPAIVHACASIAKGDAVRAVGEPCEAPSQCRGGRCIEADPSGDRVCSDVCCTDASCGAAHLFACAAAAPLAASPSPGAPPGQAFDLQCVPR
jgi:hypothetical protein